MKYVLEIGYLLGILAGATLFSLVGTGTFVLIGHVCHGDEPKMFRWVKLQINERFYGYPVY